MVGAPPLRRSPVADCVALHVAVNDVVSGWLAAAPPCPCCGSACCSMLLLAVAVVVAAPLLSSCCLMRFLIRQIHHASSPIVNKDGGPPTRVLVRRACPSLQATRCFAGATGVSFCFEAVLGRLALCLVDLVWLSWDGFNARGKNQQPKDAATLLAVSREGAGTAEGSERHVDWCKARTEAVAVAVVVCWVVVGSDIVLFWHCFRFRSFGIKRSLQQAYVGSASYAHCGV